MMRGARGPLAVVLALELLMFLPGLLQAGIYLRPPPNAAHEGLNQFLIFRQYWREQVHAGHLPLWNPYVLGGIPFLGDPQTATLYPFTFLLLLPIGLDATFKLSALLHVWVATCGMYLLCRALGANRWGAALGGYAFGFSPQIVMFVFGGWLNHMSSAAWAPGVLWTFVRATDERTPRRARFVGLGGLLLGLQLLAGHPEWAYYTLIALGALAVTLAAVRRDRARWTPIAVATALVAIGALVAAPQLVPTIEATTQSARGQAALQGAGRARGLGFPPAFLPALVVPKLFGPWDLGLSVDSWIHKVLRAGVSFGESLAYCGMLTLVLACAGVRARGAAVPPAFWAWLAGGAMVLALNDITYARSAMAWLVPAVDLFRSPVRFVFLVNLGLCVLGGLGATRVMDGSFTLGRPSARWLTRGAIVLAAAGLALIVLAPQLASAAAHIDVPAHLRANPVLADRGVHAIALAASRWGGLQLVWAALLIALTVLAIHRAPRAAPSNGFLLLAGVLAIDLIVFAWPFLTSIERPEQYYQRDLEQLAAVRALPNVGRVYFDDEHVLRAGPNVPMLVRLRAVGGYEAYRLQAYERFFAAAQRDLETYLAVFGTTHRVRTRVERRVVPAEPWTITPVRGTLPRIYWTDRAIATTPEQALPRVQELVGAAAPAVFVHDCGGETPAPSSLGEHPPPRIAIDEPEHVAVSSDSDRDGWLVLNEMYYPGWRASIDGADVQVCRVNAVMRGVRLPAGRHTIDFRFHPTAWTGAWAASLLGLLACALLLGSRSS